jgi:geranylgeranyl pyrophosphate synthase
MTADPAAGWPIRPELLEEALAAGLPRRPAALSAAMRYAVLGGGKRLRSRLALSAAVWLGEPAEAALPAARAVEYIHAYSLVHDDLPAMDDDDVRRGRPSLHRAFGEATAILAGDALQAAAFATLADPGLVRRRGGERVALAVRLLGRAAGAVGMVGGQSLDLALAATPAGPGRERELGAMVRMKTAALFTAAAVLGGVVGGGSPAQVRYLARLGRRFGLRYQIWDDLGDLATDAPGHNLAAVWGAAAAERRAAQHSAALRRLLDRPGTDALRWLGDPRTVLAPGAAAPG